MVSPPAFPTEKKPGLRHFLSFTSKKKDFATKYCYYENGDFFLRARYFVGMTSPSHEQSISQRENSTVQYCTVIRRWNKVGKDAFAKFSAPDPRRTFALRHKPHTPSSMLSS
jgi:hypothetical protein